MKYVDFEKLEEYMDSGEVFPPSINAITTDDERNSTMFGLGSFLSYFKKHGVKERYQETYGFSIITSELVSEIMNILNGRHVMELGSGTGYLAAALESQGALIYTVDTDDWGFSKQYRKTDLVESYRNLDVSGYDLFIMSWPNWGETAAGDLLTQMKSGDTLIYCGESYGGCTADGNLYDELDANWELQNINLSYVKFPNLHDYWRVYVKK